MSTITILDPTFEIGAVPVSALAPRRGLGTEELTLTLIENGKPNARLLLTMVADGLRTRLPLGIVDVYSKPSAGKPIDADEAEMLAARSHLVISGVGD